MVKIGRNDPCPCGREKKYKRCCYLDPAKNEQIVRAAAQASTQKEFVALLNQSTMIYRLKVTLTDH